MIADRCRRWPGRRAARRGCLSRRIEEADQARRDRFSRSTPPSNATCKSNSHRSQKMQAIGQLAGGVAHDFNNVLTAIIGYSDLLLANHRPTDPSFQDIMQIKQNANRAAGLVRQLLAFSRRQTLRPQALQLGDVLSELQMLHAPAGRREDRAGPAPRPRPVAGQGRPQPVRAGHHESDRQCPRRHARRRQDHHSHPQCRGGGMRRLWREIAAPRRLCAGRGRGYRDTAFRPKSATRSSSRSSPPRKSARAPASACPWSMASSSRPAALFSATAKSASGTTFRIFLPAHIPERGRRRSRPRPRTQETAADLHRPWHDPAGRGRGGGARFRRPRAGLARLYGAGGGIRRRGACASSRRRPSKIDLVVSDVVMPEMDGPTMFGELRKRGIKAEGHLRVRLCRGRLCEKPAGRRGFRLLAQALHAQAVDRNREVQHAVKRNKT